MENDLTIIPVLNKIDLPAAGPISTLEELAVPDWLVSRMRFCAYRVRPVRVLRLCWTVLWR